MLRNLCKISLIFCLLAAFSLRGLGQENLVPNPSFEDTMFCPSNSSHMPLDWLIFGNSPDFLHGCSSVLNVPNTPTGYHPANSGVGMVGVANYVDSTSSGWPDYREFLGVQITNPLTVGQKYYMSFFLSYARIYPIGSGGIGSDKLGMKFSTVQYFENNPPALNNSAHLYTDSIHTDTAQWVKVSGSFIADSAYTYLIIGNFFDESQTNTLYFGGPPYWTSESYYFFDDICVTTDSLYNETWIGLEELGEQNFGNPLSVFPNPASSVVTINCDLKTPFNIKIYNTVGQLLHTEQNVTNNNLQLDISPYNKGFLFININSQNSQFIYKLLKQ